MITYSLKLKYYVVAVALSALFITGSFVFISNKVLSNNTKGSVVNSGSDNSLNQGFIVLKKGTTFVALNSVGNEIFAEDKHADIIFRRCISTLAASGGGEIKVENGVFPFHTPVKLESRIKILRSGRTTTFVPASDNTDGVIFVASGKDEILLSDFVCQVDVLSTNEKASGIIIENCGDCKVRSVFIRDFSGYGFWLRNDSFLCRFVDCAAANNGKAEYYISDINAGGRGGDYIKNCTSYASRGKGIEVYASLCVNTVGCNMYHPKRNGYYFQQGSNSILLSGSRCFKAEGNGILIENSHELNVSSNYEAVPSPKIVIAVGACAISGGPFMNHSEAHNGADSAVPVDLYVPGCPPNPYSILHGLLGLIRLSV